MPDIYPILSIAPDQVIGDEQLGTKPKFWFEHAGSIWLFKEAREIDAPAGAEIAGEDWSEKIAVRIPTIVTAHTDERDRYSVRASVVFRV